MRYFFTILMLSFGLSASNSYATNTEAQTSFDNLDNEFVRIYNQQNAIVGQNTFPILVISGFKYTLYMSTDKSESFSGLVAPFNELKAVSHIGPALFAIGRAAWRNPKDKTWRENLIKFQEKVKIALDDVEEVDWSNPAWPNKGNQLKSFMRDSLQMVDQFITHTLDKDSFTLEDYQTFSQHYMHTMIATMFLADLGNTKAVLNQLKQWKNKLGSDWDNLYVLIMGTKGRTTSELTIKTNTAAITVASLMKKDNVKSHIIIMPGASNLTQAQNTLGAIINTTELGQMTFVTPRAKVSTGIYKASQTANVPLAKYNVQNIVTKEAEESELTLPQFNLLPKDTDYYNSLKTQKNETEN